MKTTTERSFLTDPLRSPLRLELQSPKLSSSNASVVFGKIRLSTDITPANFYSSWICVSMVGIIIASTATLEPSILRKNFKVSEEKMGTVESTLLGIDYALKIVTAMVFGPLVDRFGRKMMFIAGVIITVMGYFLVPMSTSVYSTYLPLKSLTSIGVIALQILPLNADYVNDAYKGVSSGLQYTVSFLGAACSAGLLYVLTAWGLTASYYGIGIMLLSFGVLNCFLLKPGNKYYLKKKSEEEDRTDEQKSWKEHLKEVWKQIREVPWISIAIVTSMLTYADVYLVTGITLWMQGLTESRNYVQAAKAATKFQLIFAGCSFVSSLVYGFLVQKVNLIKFIMSVMLASMIGLVLVFMVDSPNSLYLYAVFAVEGLTLPGVFLFSTFCAIRYNPPRYRGTLQGIGVMVGMTGAVVTLVLGGILYDSGVYASAFLLYFALLVLVFVAVMLIYFLTGNKGKKENVKSREN